MKLTSYHFYAGYETSPSVTIPVSISTLRILKYTPSWSTARVSLLSNYLKVFGPIFSEVETADTARLLLSSKVLFGSSGEVVSVPANAISYSINGIDSDVIRGINSHIVGIGYPLRYIEKITPIRNGCSLSRLIIEPKVWSIDGAGTITEYHNLIIPTTMIIRTDDDTGFVIISGISDGKSISELIDLSADKRKTANKFTVITQISSNRTVSVTNIINDQVYIENGSKDKRYISKDGKSITVESHGVRQEFASNFDFSKIFVNAFGDMIGLSGGFIYAGKIGIRQGSFMNVNQSYNNNKFVSVDSSFFKPNDEVSAVIDGDALSSIIKSPKIRIEVATNTGSSFISPEGDIVSDSQYFDIPNGKKSITFQTETDDREILIKLHVYGSQDPFMAGSISQDIEMNRINISNVFDMFIHNDDLVISIGNLGTNQSYIRLLRGVVISRMSSFGEMEDIAI